jgi:hypothetical protein
MSTRLLTALAMVLCIPLGAEAATVYTLPEVGQQGLPYAPVAGTLVVCENGLVGAPRTACGAGGAVSDVVVFTVFSPAGTFNAAKLLSDSSNDDFGIGPPNDQNTPFPITGALSFILEVTGTSYTPLASTDPGWDATRGTAAQDTFKVLSCPPTPSNPDCPNGVCEICQQQEFGTPEPSTLGYLSGSLALVLVAILRARRCKAVADL